MDNLGNLGKRGGFTVGNLAVLTFGSLGNAIDFYFLNLFTF